MAKIRMIQPAPDKDNPAKMYRVGEILDLGGARNKAAVDNRLAVFVDASAFEKEKQKLESEGKFPKEGAVIMPEKVEAPRGKKKVVAKGKAIPEKVEKLKND